MDNPGDDFGQAASRNSLLKVNPVRAHCNQRLTAEASGGDKGGFVHPGQGFATEEGVVVVGDGRKYGLDDTGFGLFYTGIDHWRATFGCLG